MDTQASAAWVYLGPVGRPPAQMGAGAWIGVRANEKFEYMNVPNTSTVASQLERYVQQEAMDLVGSMKIAN